MAAIAYFILQKRILHLDGPDSVLAKAVGKDFKGKISPVLYLVGIPSAFISPWIAGAFYVIVALMWIVPDRRIEGVAPATRPMPRRADEGSEVSVLELVQRGAENN
jgi:hypothetical protein